MNLVRSSFHTVRFGCFWVRMLEVVIADGGQIIGPVNRALAALRVDTVANGSGTVCGEAQLVPLGSL